MRLNSWSAARSRAIGLCIASGAIACAMVGAQLGAQAPQRAPDTIFYNGHIVTVDAAFSTAQAVAVAGGVFTAVGSDQNVRRLAGPSTAEIDLRGRTVIPGLMDNHLHGAGVGPGVDLSRARSLDDVLKAVAARVRQS